MKFWAPAARNFSRIIMGTCGTAAGFPAMKPSTLLIRANLWRPADNVSGKSGFGIRMAGHRPGARPPCGAWDCLNKRTGRDNGSDGIKEEKQTILAGRNGFGFPRETKSIAP